jgi:hypothetical protein
MAARGDFSIDGRDRRVRHPRRRSAALAVFQIGSIPLISRDPQSSNTPSEDAHNHGAEPEADQTSRSGRTQQL